MPKCGNHMGNITHYAECKDVTRVAPSCDKKCPGNSATYNTDKHKGTSSYGLKSTDAIKADLV